MIKTIDRYELVQQIAKRSSCKIQVGALIYDGFGIFSWGWNNSGPDGLGLHAEIHAIQRANKSRLVGSKLIVASIRRNKLILSKPCKECARVIFKYKIKLVSYSTQLGFESYEP